MNFISGFFNVHFQAFNVNHKHLLILVSVHATLPIMNSENKSSATSASVPDLLKWHKTFRRKRCI